VESVCRKTALVGDASTESTKTPLTTAPSEYRKNLRTETETDRRNDGFKYSNDTPSLCWIGTVADAGSMA
jgi:hypothetical protein